MESVPEGAFSEDKETSEIMQQEETDFYSQYFLYKKL